MESKIHQFENKLSRYSLSHREEIIKALHFSRKKHTGQTRLSGEPFFIHPLAVAEILVDMKMDFVSVVVALLHDVLEDTETSTTEMEAEFGSQVVGLVKGMTKISTVKAISKSVQQTETLRKMLIAMTKDIRVIIVKLADKYHNMSTLRYMSPEKQKSLSRECLEIYAPLADRLGISWLKAELEDLSLKHLDRETYTEIAKRVKAYREENKGYLRKVEQTLLREARRGNIDVKITTRVKHLYSIYSKMKSQGKRMEEIYDILGIRLITAHPQDCYTLLGIVHRLWPPIENRFKDYVAMPKANRYQSLHTTVMCFEGVRLEIQIRTPQMHRTAEYGVAAHWTYKHPSPNRLKPKDHDFINKLRKWNSLSVPSAEFLEEIKAELLTSSIYVFTPRSHIVELPQNSTAVDFAYHIHTEIGNRCTGAKADGVIIPLNTPLKNSQVIEVITSTRGKPNTNWLRFVQTAKARNRIRQWLNKNDESLLLDKRIIAKRKLKEAEAELPQEEPTKQEQSDIVREVVNREHLVYKVKSEKNTMISLAGCCRPMLGDRIIGYISRGRGIIVHRRDCSNLPHISEFTERSIDVEWEAVSPKRTRRFRVVSKMTNDLFSEIEGAVRKYSGHLIEGKLEEDDMARLTGSFTMELDNKDDYRRVLKNIRTIPSILNLYEL